MRRRNGPSPETRSIYGPLTARASMPRVQRYRRGERPDPLRTTSAYPIPQSTVEEPRKDSPAEVEPFEGPKPFNLTLVVAPEDERDKFSALEHKHTYREIRPDRAPGQRGAYQVEMTYPEYQRALEDTRDPDVNLIAVEPEVILRPHSIPGAAVETYMDMGCRTDLGLDGKGIDVGIVEYGYGTILTNYFAGRVKAKQGFGGSDPDSTASSIPEHGAHMASIAVPPSARIVAAAYDGTDTTLVEALYWMVDEIGVHVINLSQGSFTGSTIKQDVTAHISQKNVPFFVSRGNEGTDQPEYPASYPGALAISNYIPSTGAIQPESSFGGLFAAAAGEEIYGMQPDGTTEVYISTGGTSEAAATATRTAALLLSGGASFGNLLDTLRKGALQTGAGSTYEGAGVLQLCASAVLNTAPAPPDGKGSAIGPGSTSDTPSGAGGSGDLGSIGTMPGDADPTSPECQALLAYLDTFFSGGPQNPEDCTGNTAAVELADYLSTNFGIDLETDFPFEWQAARNGTPQEVTVSVCDMDIVFTLDRCAGGLADPHDVDIPLDGPMTLTRTGYSPNFAGNPILQIDGFSPGGQYTWYQDASLPEGEQCDLYGGSGLQTPDANDGGEAMVEQRDPSMTLTLTGVVITYLTADEINALLAIDPLLNIDPDLPGFHVAFSGEFYVNRFFRWWQYRAPTYQKFVLPGWPIGVGVQQRAMDLSPDGDIWVYAPFPTGLSAWRFADWIDRHDIVSGTGYYSTAASTLAGAADPADQFIGTVESGYVRLLDQTNPTRVAFFLISPPEVYDKTGDYVPTRGSSFKGTNIPGYRTWEAKYCANLGPGVTCDSSIAPDHLWVAPGFSESSDLDYDARSFFETFFRARHDGLIGDWYYERGPWLEFDPNGTVAGYTTVITDASFGPSEPDLEVPNMAPGIDMDNPPIMDIPFPDLDLPCVSVADIGINMCMEDMTMPELPMPCFPDFPFGDCGPPPGTGSGVGDFGPGGDIPDDGLGNGIGTGITAGKETFPEDKCFPAGTSLNDAIDELSDMLELDPDQMTIDGTCDDTLENEKCFPKGSSIWDAIWWLSDQCGMLPIDGGDTVTISPTTPLDTTWILNEYTNLFDFTPILDKSELFWGVEVFRADISKGGTIIVPGLEVLVQVPTPFAADPQEIFRVSVDPGITEVEATRMAKGLARKMGRVSFRVTATTLFNPNLRLRHRIRIVRPSKDFDMEFMCTSITHDLSETGKFSTVEAQVILPEPELVPA